MDISLDRVVAVIKTFVQSSRGADVEVTADTRLLGDGLVDSFGLVDLIQVLEEAAGQPLADGALLPEDFETPRTVAERLRSL